MLSRFLNSSIKIGQFARFTNAPTFRPSIVASHYNQISNYATEVERAPARGRSLQSILEDTKRQMESKNRISVKRVGDILDRLKKQKVNDVLALEILRCCTYNRFDEDQSEQLKNVWSELQKQDIQLQKPHYDNLMQFFAIKGDIPKTEEIFACMVKAGHKVDSITYQRLLQVYCVNGNLEKAIDVLSMMDREEMYINEKSFNSLVTCHVLCGNIESAMDTVAKMREAGFSLNYYTLDALLKQQAKVGDIDGISKTFEMFKEFKVELLNRDIFNVICELGANGHSEHIEKLLSQLSPSMELKRSLHNAIPQFVEKHQTALVLKILQSKQVNVVENAKILIEEMVKKSSSIAEFDEVKKGLEDMGITVKTNLNVFKSALASQSIDLIRLILDEMKATSMELNENSFAKLIQLAGEQGSAQVLDAINLMCKDFKVQPQISFVSDIILPALKAEDNPLLALGHLRMSPIPVRRSVVASIVNCLRSNDLNNAYSIAVGNNIYYALDMIKRPLIKAYVATEDSFKFVQLVRLIYDSISLVNTYNRTSGVELAEADIQAQKQKFIDDILQTTLSSCSKKAMLPLLKAFVDEGFSISTEQAQKILSQQKRDLQPEMKQMIEELSSGTLELKQKSDRRRVQSEMALLKSADVQNILEIKLAQGGNSALTQKHLFLAYIREGNVAEIETLLANSKFSISNSDYALLIELYSKMEKLDEALNMLKRVTASDKKFKLDKIKVAKLVSLMVNNNRDFSEIEALLVAHRQGKAEHRIFVFEHTLGRLSDAGNVELVNKLFDALVQNSYIEPTVESTGNLVAVHIKRGDLDAAVATYERIAKEFKLVPMTMALLRKLVEDDKIDDLQRVFDVYEKSRGERNALVRLAFVFIECGKDRQARLLFEHESVGNISKEISSECTSYVKFDRLDAALGLLKATEGLYCDRHVIYQTVLAIYCKKNEADKALDLWQQYTDDGMMPKQKFKDTLAELLKKNDIPLPWDESKSETSKKTKVSQKTATN